jgi:MFS family permease
MSIISNIHELPPIVKRMAVSVFIFVLWRWLGADIFFGIYIEQIIDKIWIVWLLWAVLAAAKLSLSIPIAYINDKINPKYLLVLSKIMYIMAWLAYFGAGALQSPTLIVIAVILNGFASPILFTTNMNIIRTQTDSHQATSAFALFHTAFQSGFFIGALAIAGIVDFIPLYYVFLGIVVFSFISMIINITIPIPEEKWLRKTIDTYLLHQNVYKKVRQDLKSYNITLYITMFLQFLYGIIDYIGFLFIPLLWLSNDLTLGQIALIFAIMRIPHLLSIYFSGMLDKYNKFLVVCISYISMGAILWWLAFTHHFAGILILSLAIAVGLSLTRPIILGFIGQLVEARHKAEITGVQETFTRTGEIVWSIWFALIAQYSTIQRWFFVVGVLFILIAIGVLLQQHLFVLPKLSIATSMKNTVLNLFETFEHYVRRKQ